MHPQPRAVATWQVEASPELRFVLQKSCKFYAAGVGMFVCALGVGIPFFQFFENPSAH